MPNPVGRPPKSGYGVPRTEVPADVASQADAKTQAALDIARDALAQQESGGQPVRPEHAAAEMMADQDSARKIVEAEVTKLLAEESVRQRVRSEEVQAARAAGRPIPPQTANALSFYEDRSIMLDRDGKAAGTPGTVKRRIRATDENGRPSDSRLNFFRSVGYRVITSRVDEQPLADSMGIWAECDPLDEARWRAAAAKETRDLGSVEREYDARTREAGLQPARGPRHGSRAYADAVTPDYVG